MAVTYVAPTILLAGCASSHITSSLDAAGVRATVIQNVPADSASISLAGRDPQLLSDFGRAQIVGIWPNRGGVAAVLVGDSRNCRHAYKFVVSPATESSQVIDLAGCGKSYSFSARSDGIDVFEEGDMSQRKWRLFGVALLSVAKPASMGPPPRIMNWAPAREGVWNRNGRRVTNADSASPQVDGEVFDSTSGVSKELGEEAVPVEVGGAAAEQRAPGPAVVRLN